MTIIAIIGMVLLSISFISSSVKALLSFRSAFMTFCAKINFLTGLKRSTARKIVEIQRQTTIMSRSKLPPVHFMKFVMADNAYYFILFCQENKRGREDLSPQGKLQQVIKACLHQDAPLQYHRCLQQAPRFPSEV